MDNLHPIKTRQHAGENGMDFLNRLFDEVKYDLIPNQTRTRPHTDAIGDFIPFMRCSDKVTTAHLVQIIDIHPTGMYHVRYTIPNQPTPPPYYVYDKPDEWVPVAKGEERIAQPIKNGICHHIERAFTKNEDYPYGNFLMHYTETA